MRGDHARSQRVQAIAGIGSPVFARHLNINESTVEKWESGAKKPSGMALKLLTLVDKHGFKLLAELPSKP